jgi:hypothetical protein
MDKELYTREQFERMTALDVVCPLRKCHAHVDEPCVKGLDRIPYDKFSHVLRERFVFRLKDSAFRFFDAMTRD